MQFAPTTIQSLQDITIQRIDFNWIQSCTKIIYLRRAIKVIQHDGDYYPDLKDACYKRLQQLDPTLKKKMFNNNISNQDKINLDLELQEWENQMSKNPISNAVPVQFHDKIDSQAYFNKHNVQITSEQRVKLAQNQRNKGNQAMKSKDFNEAIAFYNKSIELDNKQSATFCNRALAFLKKNQYDRVIKDCTDALTLNPKYTKAYHRRSKAYLGQKMKVKAYEDLKEALSIQPNNNELNSELKQLRQQMSQSELKEVDSAQSKQFKRIKIQEESDSEEEQNVNEMQQLS